MVKVQVSYRIEDKLLKEIKRLAFENEITQTEIINNYIMEGLRNEGINIEELLAEWSLLNH